ncbi:MAG TPA: YjgN family protein [Polyangiaceae bacterium]
MTTSLLAAGLGELDEGARSRRLRVEFRGSASDYFRIWIAHTCLSALTLGIYGPWAKVRMKQYLYGNTLLDGVPFQYDAPPLAILVGRLVTVCLLLVSYAGTALAPQVRVLLSLALLVALPWIVVSSNRFEAHYTSYRGVRFRFAGSYAGALRTFLGAALLACTLVGLPWAYRRVKGYLVRQWSHGGVRARLSLRATRLFRPALAAGLLGVVGALCTAALFIWGVRGKGYVPEWVVPVSLLPLYLASILACSVLRAGAANLVWRGTRLGPLRFRTTFRGGELALIYFVNAIAVVASLGLLIPWAAVRLARYRAENFGVVLDGDWSEFSGDTTTPVGAVGNELAQALDIGLPVGP